MIRKTIPKPYSVAHQEVKLISLKTNLGDLSHPKYQSKRLELPREPVPSLSHYLLRNSQTHFLNSWIVLIMKDSLEYMQCLLSSVRLKNNRFSTVSMLNTSYKKYTNSVSKLYKTSSKNRLATKRNSNQKSLGYCRSIKCQPRSVNGLNWNSINNF